jgi:hypothetical protein
MAHANKLVFQAYVRAALWSSNDESNEQGGEPLDRNYSISDLAPECAAKMRADVDRFLTMVESGRIDTSGISDDILGHDLWLTRNGHGVGFRDRDLGDLGDLLSDLSKSFGEVDLYVGDDGYIYSS